MCPQTSHRLHRIEVSRRFRSISLSEVKQKRSGETWGPDVNTSSRSRQPPARLEIPNCIKGHGPSLPVCIPNPVSAMFHYLNYYRLTQRWTRPRALAGVGGEREGWGWKWKERREDTWVCAGWNRTEAEMEIKGWEELGNSELTAEMSRHLKSRLSAGSCTKWNRQGPSPSAGWDLSFWSFFLEPVPAGGTETWMKRVAAGAWKAGVNTSTLTGRKHEPAASTPPSPLQPHMSVRAMPLA